MMAVDQAGDLASVLLVDDNKANLIALSAVLSPLGVRLIQAQSGHEAIERVRLESFAVALLDVQMPEMDGFEVAQKLRALEHGKELPIIFLTAIHRDENYARKGYSIGAADYITKPFDVDVLRARVRAFVDLYQQREEVRRVQVALRTRERDEAIRRVVAFERIATAALETNDLGALLQELLSIFLDGSDVADTATILLREGDVLRTQAALTRWGDGVGTATQVPMDDDIASRIAATRRSLEINEASAPSVGMAQWLKAHNLRALYGVPLTSSGDTLGVAQVGTSRASSFTEREKRLFQAVAERAAWAVAKHQERSRLQAILSAAPAWIAIFRGKNHVGEFFNPTFCTVFRCSDMLGRPVSDLELDSRVIAVLDAAYATSEALSLDELEVNVDSLGTCFVNLTVEPLFGPMGQIDSVLLFAVDVSAQVRARREVEAHQQERTALLERERFARTEAEIANRAKDEFLATLSHELRTPLNAVLGWTARAREKAPPELDRALAIIERNAEAQARIVGDMLDLSRIISGKLGLEMGPVLVEEPIHGAIEAMRPTAETREVKLEIQVEPNIEVVADPDRLQQIVLNLLSNAIKFTPKGGHVSLHAYRENDKFCLRVRDTGQGIERGFLPHIFEPFSQADGSTTRRHGGLGLGLAIVKQLAQAHGGNVHATSEGPGTGSEFFVELPLRGQRPPVRASSALPASRSTGARNPPDRLRERLEGIKVLVVDDEPDARALVAETLDECGAQVATAECVAEAMREIERFRPNVLVSDIAMPGADGFALMRKVRALGPEQGGATPAIALTAYARIEDRERTSLAGFERHLAKPVDLERLISTVALLARDPSRGP